MRDGSGLVEALLGLDGFRVLDVCETDAEVVITVETTADLVGCWQCGTRAEAKGEEARAVSRVAAELGVCWWTVMNAVIEHGTPLVDDPDRIGAVRQLGVDETTYLSAKPTHPTIYATGLVDLEAKVLIDLVEGELGR